MILKPNEGEAKLALFRFFNDASLAANTAAVSLIDSAANKVKSAVSSVISSTTSKLLSITKRLFGDSTSGFAPGEKPVGLLSTVLSKGKNLLDKILGDVIPPTVKIGSPDKQSVATLQKSLNDRGYSLKIDGVFGSGTDSAVKDFQRKQGLTADGIVGPKTWTALGFSGTAASTSSPSSTTVPPVATASSGNVVLKIGDKGSTVVQLQNQLNKLGFMPLLIADGVFGAKTESAVKWFQKTKLKAQTGVVDSALFSDIMNARVIAEIPQTEPKITTDDKLGTTTSTTTTQTTVSAVATGGIISEIEAATSRTLTPARFAAVKRQRPADVAFVDRVSELFTYSPPTVLFFNQLSSRWGAVIRTLASHEGSFNNKVVGGANEITTFQLLPKTVEALKSKYKLASLDIDNPSSLSDYLRAMVKDMDAIALITFKRSLTGLPVGTYAGIKDIDEVLGQLSVSNPLVGQAFTFFMMYNAWLVHGISSITKQPIGWNEEWRIQEALTRTLTLGLGDQLSKV